MASPPGSTGPASLEQAPAPPRREQRFAKEVASLEPIFALLHGFVAEQALGPDLEFCLSFVTEEIFTNMVKYNGGSTQPVRLAVSRDGSGVLIELTDFDVEPFDPATAPAVDVDAPLEERRPGGLGLHLVRSLADRLTFEYDDRELKVSIWKRLP